MEAEKERVKAKGVPKSVRKSPVKRVKVTKKDPSKPKSCKGLGTTSQKKVEGRELTREERVAKLEKQKVLNGRVWEHLFEAPAPYFHGPEVREFYCKMELLDGGGIRTIVREGSDPLKIANLLVSLLKGIPSVGT
ncbi:hypothetical protein KY285_023901 [Solanum tuberosum]|nr:hypothetical protein KY289_024232 [Solanum tuberosum]KAH0676100.1 hypothetical protein KY285_023901 [Solanum tuberosum]